MVEDPAPDRNGKFVHGTSTGNPPAENLMLPANPNGEGPIVKNISLADMTLVPGGQTNGRQAGLECVFPQRLVEVTDSTNPTDTWQFCLEGAPSTACVNIFGSEGFAITRLRSFEGYAVFGYDQFNCWADETNPFLPAPADRKLDYRTIGWDVSSISVVNYDWVWHPDGKRDTISTADVPSNGTHTPCNATSVVEITKKDLTPIGEGEVRTTMTCRTGQRAFQFQSGGIWYGGCASKGVCYFVSFWLNDRITAVKTQGDGALTVWEHTNCFGRNFLVGPNQERDFTNWFGVSSWQMFFV
ncbi:hypothetical protein K402DRAFT_197506 [Aulographum hederae CBS 113979]|uniref:Uncharacterized protein n=1 Tax=Aulographum hederae CBS 113979 TaxID=1176131 RepID=A0A6G1GNP1_9PEZI|nr:hypothetical protein K402DRAFT_197506 [Aulographum hederae CBS 113979]